jgi:hypothetical protein
MPGKRWELVVSSTRGGKGGEETRVNARVGMIFENDDGSLGVKLDHGVAIVGMPGATIRGYVPSPRPTQHRPGGPGRPSPASGTADEEWGT